MTRPISKLLIANRGEIACRVIKTAQRMGVHTVAVYSDADAQSLHVALADESVRIGPPAVSESYLKPDVIIEAALTTGAQAIHPGYGFLSENPDFVDAVEAVGLIFVGPSAAAIRAMGLKDAAKDLMLKAGVPVVPGYQGANQDAKFLAQQAEQIGYPVLIKARAGGGGKGMRKVENAAGFSEALASAQRESKSAFGDDHVLIEKFITSPRHIEVQVFGDNYGNAVHLFERDCSLQRRHQKVIEEAPAPGITDDVRDAMTRAAVTAAKAINYSGAGTIEFIVDGSGALRPDGFWFMEMNTRLQVEHPVTEAVTGVDLVEWQLRVAAGEQLPCTQDDLTITGHAFEARLYAEDPANGFLPATGKLHHLSFSDTARNDTGVRTGDEISPWYDPMIAKVITHGESRAAALAKLSAALQGTHVAGTSTNAQFLESLAGHKGFNDGQFDTGLIDRDLAELVGIQELDEVHVALAILAATGIDPNAKRAGWRLWELASHTARILFDGVLIERRIILNDDGAVTITGGETDVSLTHIHQDGLHISARTGSTNQRITAQTVRSDMGAQGLISVLHNGVVRDFILPDPRAGDAAVTDQSDVVLAPMTGVLIQLSVSAGDAVKQGDKLGVMEAMKMETGLIAPRKGIVATIACAEGQSVEGGAVLITFEQDDAT